MPNILKTEKKVAAISMLCEGSSIRAVERITGIHGDTIGRLAMCESAKPANASWMKRCAA
jgi:hypothetical protein